MEPFHCTVTPADWIRAEGIISIFNGRGVYIDVRCGKSLGTVMLDVTAATAFRDALTAEIQRAEVAETPAEQAAHDQ